MTAQIITGNSIYTSVTTPSGTLTIAQGAGALSPVTQTIQLLETVPGDRFERLIRLTQRLFGTAAAMISLGDGSRYWLKLSEKGELQAVLMQAHAAGGLPFCQYAAVGREVFVVADTKKDARFYDDLTVQQWGDSQVIRFYAGCPIRSDDDQKIGTLCVLDHAPRAFDNEDKAALQDLAKMVEQDISSLQLACTDELTRLANRRGFTVLAQHTLSLCGRLNKPATLLFIDLDGFKGINDQHGHLEGDRALMSFADLLVSSFRDSDIVGRLGGDEFAVLLTNNDAATVHATLARLKKAVNKWNVAVNNGYELQYSVGTVSWSPQDSSEITPLLDQADRSMYAAKNMQRQSALNNSNSTGNSGNSQHEGLH